MEETEAFPQWDEIAKAGGATDSVTSRNIEQHHAFEVGFEEFRVYAEQMQKGEAKYDGRKVRVMLEEFAKILNEHLHDEVQMILDLEKYDGVALKKVMDAAGQASINSADPVSYISSLPLLSDCSWHACSRCTDCS